jgi:hypothetical protein
VEGRGGLEDEGRRFNIMLTLRPYRELLTRFPFPSSILHPSSSILLTNGTKRINTQNHMNLNLPGSC